MKRLIEHIANRTASDLVLIQDETALSADAILSRVSARRSTPEFPWSQIYRSTSQDDLNLILDLLAADGWSSKIILDPIRNPPSPSAGEAFGSNKVSGVGAASDHDPAISTDSPDEATSSAARLERAETHPSDTEWLLATSGTTGSPKRVPHSLASLSRTIRTDQSRGAGLRWGLVYDPRRFGGLQVVLQAILGGSSLVVPSDRLDFERTVSEFRRHHVNAISATPSYWRKLMLTGLATNLDLQIITLGGEIADAAILKSLRQSFPQARITHIYASTEAGVGFAVHDGKEGFPKSFLQSPPQGVELNVDTHGYLMVRSGSKASTPGPSGDDGAECSHHTPCDGYFGETRRYADGTPLADAEGWVCTDDLVEKRGDRFFFLGRANGIINVGGDKVHPKEIEDVAQSVQGVVLALARAKLSPIVGQVPGLLIESDGKVDPMALRETVLERCRTELPRFKWPAVVQVVDEIVLTDMGKVARR